MYVGNLSFWQQNQNYLIKASQNTQALAQNTAIMNVMADAMTSLSNGMASIANQTALSRVNTQLSSAVQNALNGASGAQSGTASSSSSSGSASSSPSSSSSSNTPYSPPVPAAPATGTGTVPLTTGTSLFALGILPQGTISVGDGTFTTTYTSTGTDTVGDLLGALNATVDGHANVAAWLDSSGKLVITAKDNIHNVTVGGIYASALGFGAGNNNFTPTVPASSAGNASGSSGSSSSSTSSASSNSSTASPAKTTPTAVIQNAAPALHSSGTAELLLASRGFAGTIVNLLT